MANTRTNPFKAATALVRGSTTKIIKWLTKQLYGIPASLPDNDPKFLKVTELEIKSAQLVKENAKSTNITNVIQQASNNISAALTELGRIKQTLPMQAVYEQKMIPLKAEIQERMSQREDISKKIKALIQEKDTRIAGFVSGLADNKPIAMLMNMLETLEKKQIELAKVTERQRINEESLLKKMMSLYQEIIPVTKAATGAQFQPIGETTPTPRNE